MHGCGMRVSVGADDVDERRATGDTPGDGRGVTGGGGKVT